MDLSGPPVPGGSGSRSPLGNEVLLCHQEQGEGLGLQRAEFLLA